MKRMFFAVLAATAMLFAFVAPAAAEGHTPAITIEPSNVDAAGEYEFTMTGDDFEDVGGFIIPCPGLSTERVAEEDFNVQTECDLATGLATGTYTPADGTFEHTMTLDVPADGLTLVFGDQGGANAGAFVVTVGAAAEAEEEAAPAEEEEEATDDALAETGVESAMLLVLGGAVVVAGGLFVNTRRQFNV